MSGLDNSDGVVTPIGPGPADGDGDDDMRPDRTAHTELTREPIAIDDCGAGNPAGLSPADVERLKAGGAAAPGMRWLYPYEGTVFPRGMLAPDLMWDGPPAEVVYVHIKSEIFEYWGCLRPIGPNRVAIPQDPWERAGERSRGKNDFFTIELSTLTLGAVSGPLTRDVQIAQAAIKGSIYYNTYRSALPGAGALGIGGVGGTHGIVVRIPAGGSAEVFGQTDCNGCHSVSADGSHLLAQSVLAGTYSYELSADGPAPTPTMAAASGAWAALYPDGSAFLSMSSVIDVARAGIFGGFSGKGPDAALYDTESGQAIPNTGIPVGALMPFFSPDGTLLVFNDYAIDGGRGLALMKYDTKAHKATGYGEIYRESDATLRPGWPFVLPDNRGVLFTRTNDFDFSGGGVGVTGAVGSALAPYSELSVIDLDSQKVTLLARAMGYDTPEDAAQGNTYTPFGQEDVGHAYYPTVSPVAAGGYFWVFFDSVRHYGNLGVQRQAWGAAIDISATGDYESDPSYPAFYLSGQEFGTGNHRAFAALDPCRKDGDSCTTGIDCCGGSCYISEPPPEFGEPTGSCSPPMNSCALRDERCTSDADCCPPEEGPANTCIAGFCAFVPPPI